ncbi:MAG: arginine--tRNA ligase [Hyphomicrobiales bacterium]|nr:arginine--tRNA ligase [Hyphomicrobiales bacterium]
MNVFDEIALALTSAFAALQQEGRLDGALTPDRFSVEPPRDASHGDIATNIAMVYARDLAPGFTSPRQFATEIVTRLGQHPLVAKVDVAGPGFINIRLQHAALAGVLRAALQQKSRFGRPPAHHQPVNVEYVSANPTGPMHVGHGRGAVFGDALAALLEFAGARVTREFYINDAGAQVDVLARSAFLRYREARGETIGAIPEGLYPGDYLKAIGAQLARDHGDALAAMPEKQWLPLVRQAAIDAMMALIRDDLAALNIRHDVFFSEASLTRNASAADQVRAAIDALQARGLIYQGTLPPPKGALPDDWEDREQTLFRSTQFGDDVDRALMKSDGSYTYFASDIAYHADKLKRGFSTMIDIWGADHGGYVKRMKAAVAALSDGKGELDIKLCQLVKLMRDGEPVKMSKRSGEFVTLREVVDEVGVDAVRFMMLFRKNDAPLDFDLAKVIEKSRENPVFYVQYAFARTQSAFRQAAQVFPDLNVAPEALAASDLDLVNHPAELELLRIMAQFPRLIDQAARAHEPHRVAFYLHDLASALHSHWTAGKDMPHLRFVNEENRQLTQSRLALVAGVAEILRTGLALLGVGAPDEMR